MRHPWLVLTLAAACAPSSEPAAPVVTPLDISISAGAGAVPGMADAVKADGSSVVTIDVAGATTGPIRVTASRGSFADGTGSVVVEGTSASVELLMCDAVTDAQCAGTLTITAFDGATGYGQKKLTLVGVESSCANGRDDNGDRRSDCGDPDCDGQTCASGGAPGTCTAGVCVLPTCTPTAASESCENGIDDDCDHAIDCAQSACDGQPCRAGSPAMACRAGACTDLASGLAVTVTPLRTRLPADGVAQTTVTVKLTKSAAAQAGAVLDLAVNLGGFGVGAATRTTTSVTTGADGTALVTYQAAPTDGVAVITATLRDNPTVVASASITLPVLGTITLGSIQNPVMGVKFSGWNEQNQLAVVLLDSEQKPYPDGLAVRFEHQQLGGSTISTPTAPDTTACAQSKKCLAFVGQTVSPQDKPDTTGLAPLTLYSGTAAGPVAVTVTATAGGVARNLTVSNIVIVGAKVSGGHVSLFCTPQNTPGFIDNDCTNSFYVGAGDAVSCTVFLADRFNNVLGVATRADFRSEAGSPGPPVSTKAYDPVLGGDQTTVIGRATNSVAVTGFRLPIDVPPLAGEFSAAVNTGCGTTVHNPRDGLSAVIAAVQGEEGFVDLNGNGVYELGEPFIDSSEPFVDENDSGVRDNDERFIDVNEDGDWDAPNGVWDADTVVWAEARVVYSSAAGEASRVLATAESSLPPGATAPVTFSVAPDETQTFALFFTDDNYNPLSPLVTYAASVQTARVLAAMAPAPLATQGLGMAFTQQYCDEAPPATATACAATCQHAPCYRVTRVGGYQYGNRGVLSITGDKQKTGPDVVTVGATVDGVGRSVVITGTNGAPESP